MRVFYASSLKFNPNLHSIASNHSSSSHTTRLPRKLPKPALATTVLTRDITTTTTTTTFLSIKKASTAPAVVDYGGRHYPKKQHYSRWVAVGLMGGGPPEGPRAEEGFWDNVRRYGLYALTVSTGAIYTIFLPIVELLKNPITALLVLALLAGAFYLVSQVVSAMVGISDFSYQYSY